MLECPRPSIISSLSIHPSISNWELVYRTPITFSKVAGWKSVRFWKTLRVRRAGTHSSIIHDSGRTFRAGISKLPPGVNVPCTLNKSRNQCPRLQPLCFQKTETAVGNQIWYLNRCRSPAWLWESLLRVTSGGAVSRGRQVETELHGDCSCVCVCCVVLVPAEWTKAQKQDQYWRALRSITKSSKSGQKKSAPGEKSKWKESKKRRMQ